MEFVQDFDYSQLELHRTSYGLGYYTITPEQWEEELKPAVKEDWSEYDINLVEIHIKNCGLGILDEAFYMPIDNEYDLDAIYNDIEESK